MAKKYSTGQRASKNQSLEGGHNIPKHVIERRYFRGIKNLFKIYLPIVDGALIFDNLYGKHELIAQKTIDDLDIINKQKFNELKNKI